MEWLAALQLLIVALTLACARMTQPDRNYWPMLRVVWSALAFIYTGAAVNSALGGNANPVGRIVFTAAMLVAISYAAWFMRKRNRTPRFIRLSVDGEYHLVPLDELQRAADLVGSWAAHGAMDDATVAQLDAALGAWRSKDEWRTSLVREVRKRRAAKDKQ